MTKINMFLTLLACVLLFFMLLALLGGCIDPRRTFHAPGTYDCCVKAWHDPNQE